MREDMDKLLVLRPRTRLGWHQRGTRRRRREARPDEQIPRKEGMRGPDGCKYPSEYFNPLLRFLERRVGSRWDDVYAEIRERLSPKSAVHMHVMVHLEQFVITRTWLQDGQVWGDLSGPENLETVRWGYFDFFVCPRSGRLRSRKFKRRRPQDGRVRSIRRLGSDRRALLLKGLWFEVELAKLPSGKDSRGYDVVLRREVGFKDRDALRRAYGLAGHYGVRKRAMSKRDIAAAKASPSAMRSDCDVDWRKR